MEENRDTTETLPAVSCDGLIADFLAKYPQGVLEILLLDRTTGRNIVWADDEYVHLGEGFGGDDEVTLERITGDYAHLIKLRTEKAAEHQSKRTKSRAEVFTPSWLCNYMNNRLDEEWFGRPAAFNVEDGASWEPMAGKVEFPAEKGRGWGDYVRSTRLEITCGEAPFLCSRYDTVTGEAVPVAARVGVLDRKLRVAGEHARSRAEWARAALAALKATYGYEYQGDNLLIARINVLETLGEHFEARWGEPMSAELAAQAAEVVSWNLWQMDGLRATAPTNAEDALEASVLTGELVPVETPPTRDLFGPMDEGPASYRLRCVIKNWKANEPFEFAALKGQASQMAKKFYAVIGNPPYQMEAKGDNNSDTPIYHLFYDASFDVADRVELISPARFLFRAGSTPAAWNDRMLGDEHVKVEQYYPDSKEVFEDVDIKGGVAILYRDSTSDFGSIGFFSRFSELTSIIKKVQKLSSAGIDSIFFNRGLYRYSELAYQEHPEEMKKTSDPRIAPSSFERMPGLFTESKPEDGHDYVLVLGRTSKGRLYRYFRRDYVKEVPNLDKFKVIISKASGTGAYGEALADPVVGEPGLAYTETYVSMGEFEGRNQAEALSKYIKTKMARALLGALKVTQNIAKPVWQYVPLQDFTPTSDIDWSKSVAEIDRQLYAKYGLDDSEIEFIETHVKEMS